MIPHAYLIKASGYVNDPHNQLALRRAEANLTVKTSDKGEALAATLLKAVSRAFQSEGRVDSVFDCGEASLEAAEPNDPQPSAPTT